MAAIRCSFRTACSPKVCRQLSEITSPFFRQQHTKSIEEYGSLNVRASSELRYFNNKDVKPLSEFLSDKFGRHHTYLRISLTERCNLRCQYCMPEEGVQLSQYNELLTTEEIIQLAKLFVSEGVNKIRLTGGEPLIRKDIVELCAELSSLDGLETLALTTNGITLKRKLPQLQDAGLKSINISLDTLEPKKFEFLTRRKGWHKVMESIDCALDLGYHPLKINCVVMRGLNDDEVCDFVALTKEKVKNGAELSSLDGLETLALTTNGITLKRKLPQLQEAGLKSINISLDTLEPKKFEFLTRRKVLKLEFLIEVKNRSVYHVRDNVASELFMINACSPGWHKVMESIDCALDLGYHPLKINCVVMRGLNDDEVCDFVALTKEKLYLDVVAIASAVHLATQYHTSRLALREKLKPLLLTFLFFQLWYDKVCLFGNAEVSLRDALRAKTSDEEMLEIIGAAVKRKKKQHAGMFNIVKQKNRPMILIGG
ncbi:PREDICTED: molybdenum cofactor biosynthesis protein 1-like [Acropora digitifera]|uniref:molybdenum cofactor biosynthesis protein 1-like n=1 Tax=Acropora digitifera TaxID=70779 RepID=UPI00077B278B|nr:PREDICTED: molybdenum cofactor biosynthesis protein 1-like [Acropora digitifera]